MFSQNTNALTRLRYILLVSVPVILCGLIGATALILYQDRENEIATAGSNVQTLALVLSKEADSTISVAEHMMDHIVGDVQKQPALMDRTDRALHDALVKYRHMLRGGEYATSFGHMFVLGADGLNIANSVSFPVIEVNASDRPYFQFHRDTPVADVHISQPMPSRVTKERRIFLTKRMNDKDGNFIGVIGVHLNLSHFNDLYSQLQLPPGGTVTVIRQDGAGIFRYPLIEGFFERNVSGRPLFEQMKEEKYGHLLSPKSPYDGYARIAGYKVSEKYPLVNIISVTDQSVLVGWLRNSVKVVIISALGAAVFIAITLFAYRQTNHLRQATELSTHDPLTKLWNRRAFDERLDEEWRRAIRREHAISLLFIDIDYFKNYNDTYGHKAGDGCLQEVAQTLKHQFGRAGELVFRYGGEEFVALLPNVAIDQAEPVAQKLVQAVAELNIPHTASQVASHVTISVGVSSKVPELHDGAKSMVEEADDALYQAKNNGRNQYVIAEQS